MTNITPSHPSLSQEELENKISRLIEELKQRLFDITKANFLNPNCIDGRDTDITRPSIPWGWLWALWVVLSYFDSTWDDYDRDEIVKTVKCFFWWELTGHTDTHQNDPQHQCQGCGHAQRLITQSERYSLSSESSQVLQQESNSIPEKRLDTLDGHHEERNVFIVDILDKGIKSHYEGKQDFVYNEGYAKELYAKIVELIQTNLGININLDKLLEITNSHFMITGWDLAKWKDVFKVTDIDTDWTPEVKYIMTIT